MIPAWMGQENIVLPGDVRGKGKGRSFLEKTLQGSAALLESSFFSELFAARPGLLQSLEPRIKLLTILLLIGAVSLLHSPWLIWGVYLFALFLAAASHIEFGFFLGRVWLCLPLFSLLIVLPVLFNVMSPGEPLWVLVHLGKSHDLGPFKIPAEIAITRPGVRCAILFIGRVAASVSLAVLLTLTTPWSRLLQAMQVLKVPAIFILTVSMAYRYLFLLVGTISDMHLARRSRTIRYLGTGAEQRWVAGRIGHLFRRSFQLSQDVHDAMLARGFSGNQRSFSRARPRATDWVWLMAVLVFCGALVGVDRNFFPG